MKKYILLMLLVTTGLFAQITRNPSNLYNPSVFNAGTESATLGSELLSNASFADSTIWTFGANWTLYTTPGSVLHTAGSTATLTQSVNVTTGATYLVTLTMSGSTTGTIAYQLGSFDVAYTTSVANSELLYGQRTFVATSTGAVTFTITPSTDFNGKIDAVSIKAVTLGSVTANQSFYNASGTLINEKRFGGGANNYFEGLQTAQSAISPTNRYNTIIGKRAANHLTAGAENTLVGVNADSSITNGYQNTGVGCEVLLKNKYGHGLTAMGVDAGYYGVNNYHSDYYGWQSGLNLGSTGAVSYNLALYGAFSGQVLLGGNNSTFIGVSSGNNVLQDTIPVNAMALGANTYTTADNQIVIGDANITSILMGQAGRAPVTMGLSKIYTGAGSSATDSSIVYGSNSGSPTQTFYGTDGDAWTLGISTADRALFSGATGGYGFDAALELSDNIHMTNAKDVYWGDGNSAIRGNGTNDTTGYVKIYSHNTIARFDNGNLTLGNLRGIGLRALYAGAITSSSNLMTNDSLVTRRETSSLADDGTITLATGVSGWGEASIGDNQEFARFRFSADGTVTLLTDCSANVVNTDTDTKFCIYDGGSGVVIKNALGSRLTCKIVVHY